MAANRSFPRSMAGLRYSSWDGSREPFEVHPEEIMDELSNDLFSDSSVKRALKRLIQRGMESRSGRRTEGIKEMLERLKERRDEQLQKYNLDSIMKSLTERLQDIVGTERRGIDRRMEEARQQAARDPLKQSLLGTMQSIADKRRETLDGLSEAPAGQIKELSDYDFMDLGARQKFEDLMDELKNRAMQQYFQNMQEFMQSMTPEQVGATHNMLRDLNQMLQQQSQGELSPKQFEHFMEQYGSMFGETRPQDMEELIDQLQDRMAQAESLLNSMDSGTRQQIREMMEGLFDEEMQTELAQLAAMMGQIAPPDELSQRYSFSGQDEISLDEAMRLMDKFQEMEILEDQLDTVRGPEDLDRIDVDKLAELLGEDARHSWEQLKEMVRRLEEAGYVRHKDNKLELTPRGVRKIGDKAIRDIFTQLRKDRAGAHEVRHRGLGGDNNGETKQWEFGDDFLVDLQKSLLNTVRREGLGTPLQMRVEDFEVQRVDHTTQAATCLLIDRSRSMGYYGNFTAAKKVTIALHTLIRSKFPRDALYIIGFSDVAHQFNDEDVAELSWDTGISGTNMHHAFMLARKLLSKHKGSTRQVIMVTDGEPTAYLDHGVPLFSYPPSPMTIHETLKEARRCTQDGIMINTFMLENSYPLVDFVNMLTRVNRGRAFYASPDRLGEYVLVDFMNNKRSHVA